MFDKSFLRLEKIFSKKKTNQKCDWQTGAKICSHAINWYFQVVLLPQAFRDSIPNCFNFFTHRNTMLRCIKSATSFSVSSVLSKAWRNKQILFFIISNFSFIALWKQYPFKICWQKISWKLNLNFSLCWFLIVNIW